MENYKRSKRVKDVLQREEIPIPSLPEGFVWMQVSDGSKMRNLLRYAADAMKEEKAVVWTGVGPSLHKAISCAEILKKKYGAYQISKICYTKVEDHWEPLLPQLEPLIVRRDIPTIHILLSRAPLDVHEPGYQGPNTESSFWDPFRRYDEKESNASSSDMGNNRQAKNRAKNLKKYTGKGEKA